jgi:hypothetical protein
VTTTLKRGVAAFSALALLLLGTVVAASPAGGTTTQPTLPRLTNIRTGLNAGFDRVVLDLTSGTLPNANYTLVDELTSDGSGEVFWLTGEFFASVVVNPADAHDSNGNPTYTGPRRFRTHNLRNVMAVGLTGDFEGYVSIGLGFRYQSWVRVFTLSAPNRVVIDVGH